MRMKDNLIAFKIYNFKKKKFVWIFKFKSKNTNVPIRSLKELFMSHIVIDLKDNSYIKNRTFKPLSKRELNRIHRKSKRYICNQTETMLNFVC